MTYGDSTFLQPLRRKCPRARRALRRTVSPRRVPWRLSLLRAAPQRSQAWRTLSRRHPQDGTSPWMTLSRCSPLFSLVLWRADGVFIFPTSSLAYPSVSPPKGLLPMCCELEMIYDVCRRKALQLCWPHPQCSCKKNPKRDFEGCCVKKKREPHNVIDILSSFPISFLSSHDWVRGAG